MDGYLGDSVTGVEKEASCDEHGQCPTWCFGRRGTEKRREEQMGDGLHYMFSSSIVRSSATALDLSGRFVQI